MVMVAGADGCRGGWVVVTVPTDGDEPTSVERVLDMSVVVAKLEAGNLSAATVDIPIGLPDIGPRCCDPEARKVIGARRNSLFPAPVRSLLGSRTYEEAAERSRRATGKSLSRQAFAILPKVEEVDLLMTPARQQVLVEMHPEISFTVLAGKPMTFHKATPEGRAERLVALRRVFPDIDRHAALRMSLINPDDILDAFVAAWSARRWLAGTHRQLGGDLDNRGLRMEMIA